jgi:hypothetical protein
MKYQVPLRWFSAPADREGRGEGEVPILDERGRQAFRLLGTGAPEPTPAGSRVLTFRDRRGDELAFVTCRQLPGVGGGVAYELRDGCSGRRCRFMADGPGPDDLHAEGDLTGREYAFTREGKPVGRVSRSMLAGAGGYGVEVGRGEDEVLLLASAVVIDLCCQPEADPELPGSRMAG